MNYIILAAILVMATFFSSGLSASETTPIDRTITRIDVLSNSVIVSFSPEYENEQNCSKTSKSAAILRDVDQYTHIYSGLLSAMHSKSKVTLGLEGCGGGSYDYPKIYRIGIKPQ